VQRPISFITLKAVRGFVIATKEGDMKMRSIGAAVAVALALGIAPNLMAQSTQFVGWRNGMQPCPTAPCPTSPYPAYQTPGATGTAAGQSAGPNGAVPGTTTPGGPGAATNAPPTGSENAFAQAGEQVAGAGQSFSPNMIGDSIAPTYYEQGANCLVSPSGGPGRFKMADDNSPLPQDRLMLDYAMYSGVNCGTGMRYTTNELLPGFEKTFLGGACSVEVRSSMSSTDTLGSHFDDLGVALKGLLYTENDLSICSGMAVNVPTAPSITTGGVTVLDQSVHLLPFAGALWTPSSRFFAQGFVQVDVDASGNFIVGTGRVYDATLLYVDAGVGYWLSRGDTWRWVSGVALISEIHVNESVGCGVAPAGVTVPNLSFVDATVGMHLDVGKSSNVTIGYVAPITGGPDRLFNGELRLLCNYRF
jgi:hypothetical protein